MATREGYHRLKGTWEPSPAERRVLDELAIGRTNAEIAVRLGLSPETVKSHVARMLGETGCADRAALARWWRAGGADRRPLRWPLLGLAARFAATAAALGVGLLLLLVGIYGTPRFLDRLELRSRLVPVVRPPDPRLLRCPARRRARVSCSRPSSSGRPTARPTG